MARLSVYTPDPILYAQQRAQEIQNRPLVGRFYSASKTLAVSSYRTARETLLGDITLQDIVARAAVSVNPLLTAVIPQQEQIQEALHDLKSTLFKSDEYLQQSVELQAESVDTLQTLQDLQAQAVEKLDTLEAIAEGKEVPKQESKIEYHATVTSENIPRNAIESENITDNEPVKVQVVDAKNQDLSELDEKVLEQLEHIRANLEALNSFFAGSEQFGLAGMIDRVFNKYTTLLNKHPLLRGLHTLTTGFIKMQMGLTKPGKVRGLVVSSVKRFLGIGEEGPLQQLVTISAGQLDIQYRIYRMIQDHFKKTDEEYKLREDTLKLFKKSPEEVIDEKIQNMFDKIPFFRNTTQNIKSEITEAVTTKISNIVNRNQTVHNIKTEKINTSIPNQKIIDKYSQILQKLESKVTDIGQQKGQKLEQKLTQVIKAENLRNFKPIGAAVASRQKLSQQISSGKGEIAVGLTSIAFPLAPSLIHLTAGNYGLAARELLYAVPVLGQLLTLKNFYQLYKEYKKENKSIKDAVKDIRSQFEVITSRIPKFSISDKTKQYKERIQEKLTPNAEESLLTRSMKKIGHSVLTRNPIARGYQAYQEKSLTKGAWALTGFMLPGVYLAGEVAQITASILMKPFNTLLDKSFDIIKWSYRKLSGSISTFNDSIITLGEKLHSWVSDIQSIFKRQIKEFFKKLKEHEFTRSIIDFFKTLGSTALSGTVNMLQQGGNMLVQLLTLLAGGKLLKGGFGTLKKVPGLIKKIPDILNKSKTTITTTKAAETATKSVGFFNKLKGFLGNIPGLNLIKTGAKGIGNAVTSIGAKGLLKKVPLVGTALGLGFAGYRLLQGDVKGAALEALSGVPLPFISLPAEAALQYRDYMKQKERNQNVNTITPVQNQEINKYKQTKPTAVTQTIEYPLPESYDIRTLLNTLVIKLGEEFEPMIEKLEEIKKALTDNKKSTNITSINTTSNSIYSPVRGNQTDYTKPHRLSHVDIKQ